MIWPLIYGNLKSVHHLVQKVPLQNKYVLLLFFLFFPLFLFFYFLLFFFLKSGLIQTSEFSQITQIKFSFSKVYSSMSFDKCMTTCHHHHTQNKEHFFCPKKFPCASLPSIPCPYLSLWEPLM